MRVHDTSVGRTAGRPGRAPEGGPPAKEGAGVTGAERDPCGGRDERLHRAVLEAVAVGCGARSDASAVAGEPGACRLTTLRGLTGIDLADLEDEVIYLEGEGLVEIEDLAAPRPRLRARITAAGEDHLAEGGNPKASPNGGDA